MTRTRISLAAAALLFGAHRGAEAQRVQIGSGLHGGGSIQTLDTRAESGRVTQLSRAWGESQRTELLWLGASHGGLWKSFEDRPGHVASWSVVTDNFPGSHTRGSFLIHSFAISFDGGANWAPYGTGIPVEKDGRISLATSSDGRFVFALVGGDHVMKGVFRLAFHFFDTAPRWMAYSTNGQRLFSVDGATALSGDQTCGGKDNAAALLIDPAPGLPTPLVYTSQRLHEDVSNLAINVHHGLSSPRLGASTQGRGFLTRPLGGRRPTADQGNDLSVSCGR